MLGERRSNSLFAPTAPAEPERKPEQAEVHDISFEERTGRSLFAENATAPRARELFFAPQEKGVTFAEALSQVQGYLAETYATLITEDNSDAKEQMKRRMARYLQENRIAVDGMTASELVDALYTEMAEYGFLTKYIFADGIEEIDINSWRDIEIQYSDGHTAKLEEHFDSPEHAANVCRTGICHGSGSAADGAVLRGRKDCLRPLGKGRGGGRRGVLERTAPGYDRLFSAQCAPDAGLLAVVQRHAGTAGRSASLELDAECGHHGDGADRREPPLVHQAGRCTESIQVGASANDRGFCAFGKCSRRKGRCVV